MQVPVVPPPLSQRMRVLGIRQFHEFARLGDRLWSGEHRNAVDRGKGCVPLWRSASSPEPDRGPLGALVLAEELGVIKSINLGFNRRSRLLIVETGRIVLGLLSHDGRHPLQLESRQETDGPRDRKSQGFLQLHFRDPPILAMEGKAQASDDPGTLIHDRHQIRS